MKTTERYSGAQIAIHWAVALLVLLQFLASESIEQSWRAVRDGGDGQLAGGGWLHVACGVSIFLLMIWRVVLRLTHGAPSAPAGEPRPLRILAASVHGLIYLLLLGMPLSGAVAWFGGVQAAAVAHVFAKTALLVLVGLHILGALVQQLVFRSNVLLRMMP